MSAFQAPTEKELEREKEAAKVEEDFDKADEIKEKMRELKLSCFQ